jgi:hypothetical protein
MKQKRKIGIRPRMLPNGRTAELVQKDATYEITPNVLYVTVGKKLCFITRSQLTALLDSVPQREEVKP